jgi:hypothetical protein
MFLAGAALGWNADKFDESMLVPVLSRDVFANLEIAKAAFELGFAHKKLGVRATNETPLGTVIAAPKPEERELFCRNGLKWFAKNPAKKIRATLKEIERQISVLKDLERRVALPSDSEILRRELALAARMAAQSCKFMLWQKAVAAGKNLEAKILARTGILELKRLQKDFNSYWPLRNKATTKHCSPFLQWRIDGLVKWLNS